MLWNSFNILLMIHWNMFEVIVLLLGCRHVQHACIHVITIYRSQWMSALWSIWSNTELLSPQNWDIRRMTTTNRAQDQQLFQYVNFLNQWNLISIIPIDAHSQYFFFAGSKSFGFCPEKPRIDWQNIVIWYRAPQNHIKLILLPFFNGITIKKKNLI